MRKILLALLFLSATTYASTEKIECIGPEPENAKSYMVFLHGAGITGLHNRNVRVLKQIAEKKKVRFAIPISQWQCTSEKYKGQPCWMRGPFEDHSYKPAFEVIEDAAEKCFRNRDYGLLGFSNGGHLVTTLKQHCVPNKFTKLIAVGMGVKGRPTDRPGLRGCSPQLNVLIGDKDHEYMAITKSSFELLKSRDADITYEVYEGAHELTAESLYRFFEN
jgi:predicted esterase